VSVVPVDGAQIDTAGAVLFLTNSPEAKASNEEQSVYAVVRTFEKAWNAHDMDAMAALFTEDAEWVAVVGWWSRGLTEVKSGFAAIHWTRFKNTPFYVESVSIRFPTPDTAIAIAAGRTGSFTAPDGAEVPGKKDQLSIFMVRRGGRWLIAGGQNTPIIPEAQQYDPVRKK
jgi:uncharacterized protein (TIGR02246 family)